MRDSWFLQRDGSEVGPVPATRLAELAQTGTLQPHDLVRRDGTAIWVLARQLQGLTFGEPRAAAPASPIKPRPPAPPKQDVLRATTADGRSVELYVDGTWRFAAASAPKSSPAVNSSGTPKSSPTVKSSAKISDNLQLRQETGADFRLAYWGMSQREVRARAKALPVEDAAPDALIYASTFADKPCRICYQFVQNVLVSGALVFDRESIDANQSISDYAELKKALRQQYGEPIDRTGSQSDQIWLNNAYRADPGNWGRAINLGHLFFLTTWARGKTRINLILKGENYDTQLMIEFVSPEHRTPAAEPS